MAASFNALSQLRERFMESHHDFRGTTDIFPSLDVDKVASDLELEEKGQERGQKNQPPSGSKGCDETELAVIERVEDEKKKSHNTMEDQLVAFDGRLSRLDFDGKFGLIRLARSSSISDFRGMVAVGLDVLHGLRRDLNMAEQEVVNFRMKHGLNRAARLQEGMWFGVKIAILVLLFFFEWYANAIFLSGGSEEGILGGMVLAVSFALGNIVVALLIALFGARFLLHRFFWPKVWGLAWTVVYVCFAVGLNLVLAHYRSLSESSFEEVGAAVMSRVWNDPLGLPDVQSWLLFLVGFLFSVIAFIDGLFLLDPYPGYGAAEKRRKNARQKYVEEKENRIDILREVRDDHNKTVDGIIKGLSKDKREYSGIVDHRARLVALFNEHQNQLERACNQLLQRYRDANVAARTDAPPEHFKSHYKMTRIKLRVEAGNASTKKLEEAIAKAQEELAEQIRLIGEECQDGIAKYQELDRLYPDHIDGQAV